MSHCGFVFRHLCVFVSLLPFLMLGASSPAGAVEADRIILEPYSSGDSQCELADKELPKPLRVVVQGPQERGFLGGEGERKPIVGHEVTFAVEDPESGAVFVESDDATYTATTDAAGVACVHLKLGDRCGDVNVLAKTMTANGEKTVQFRETVGVELIGEDLEGATGGLIEEFGVHLRDSSGAPVPGVDVYFRLAGDGHKAKLGKQRLKTDDDGMALTSLKLGEEVGRYFVSVEIQDTRQGIREEERFNVRPFQFEVMATSKSKMLITLFGGLAVFIYGMKLMSEGLQRMADRRLKAILHAMTRNRFLAIAVGALLTAMVQSSSATTVMVVGFVNAGLMNLTQAIGVIYGANVGTTITAQIIAFKLNALAYPAIALGLVMAGLARKAHHKHLGETILGFGLLFLGMSTMSDILKPLRYSPEFRALFQLFECSPVDGAISAKAAFMSIVIGAVATGIIQSSSATTGLILALASQGLVSFYTAVPLILGTNIGTTITAMLASIGANRNARRAALAHTLFNTLGSAYMYALLFLPWWNGHPVFLGLVDAVTPGDVFASTPENLVRHVANAHTAFNVINCLLFLPFVGVMASLCQRIIPLTDVDQEKVMAYLEPHLLHSPSIALQQAVREVAYMLRRSHKSINEGCRVFHGERGEIEKKIASREELIDKLQHEITSYLVELSEQELSPAEASMIPALVHAVNDAERIGDHSEDLVELAHLRSDREKPFSGQAEDDMKRFESLLDRQFRATQDVLLGRNGTQMKDMVKRENEINEFFKKASDAHVRRLEAGECDVQNGVIFLDFLAHLERVADHVMNIAERAGRMSHITADMADSIGRDGDD